MTHTDHEIAEARDDVTRAQGALDKLERVQRLLETDLPAARCALQVAEKRLREMTKPSKAAIREAELQILHDKLNTARGGAQNV